ncbi:hypothetical protein [Asticcacaulis benevestitus]|uniref:DUF3592 domain-containing protein n=1 Tax=Asticcacaulis benevestitus DSM 16100 = ATCC BAA-896 TaxID=1121022 RepID=V4PZJ3_9CAUL|nr:hypothetical protein [Asticcacaulis benevestitus]ESQ93801.1 hypothetical protein ABENE_03715 [Asticcacaulis benevestitus DSM 16100 = ATCC BAA-896]
MSVENLKHSWWFPALALLWFVLAMGPQVLTSTVLKLSSQEAAAVITTAPLEHVTCKYQFSVGDRYFIGKGHDCANAPVGGSITIYYWPTHPLISSNVVPGSDSSEILSDIVIGLLIFMGATLIASLRSRDD